MKTIDFLEQLVQKVRYAKTFKHLIANQNPKIQNAFALQNAVLLKAQLSNQHYFADDVAVINP